LPLIDFGREICNNYAVSSRKEWLVTNGIGGYASGTVAGVLTRRYHGLLLAALKPPLGRTLLITKFNETIDFYGQYYPIYCDLKSPSEPSPRGYLQLERFFLEDSIPVWVYACAEARLEKRIWMQVGENTTYIHYSYKHRGNAIFPGNRDNQDYALTLSLRALVNYRDYHSKTKAERSAGFQVEQLEHGLKIIPAEANSTPFYILGQSVTSRALTEWDRLHHLAVEFERGESELEDHLAAGEFQASLKPGEELTLVATTEANAGLDGRYALRNRRQYESRLFKSAGLATENSSPANPSPIRNSPEYRQLILAADQFIVRRPSPTEPQGSSIIAGYPWFSDWGRDTMISLPGLTLVTGRPEVARHILRTYAAFLDQGMLPNRFPDIGEEPEYNTIDATLWYFEALRSYVEATADASLLEELFPKLQEIIGYHIKGTRYNIRVDPQDGLLSGGAAGVQLTWMDAKVEDWVVTPRIGKAVEINALWYNALKTMEWICRQLRMPADSYTQQARYTYNGFSRFWNPDTSFLYDILDGPDGDDPSLRPNQLLAISLHDTALELSRQRAVVDACARYLHTSLGMRSLAASHPSYIGRYGGTRYRRDAAYHQGTVWGWLIGPFISAYLRVYQNPQTALAYLSPLLQQLGDHGLGSISEIFDGDPPHSPDGCFAQAWSVAEVLRLLDQIDRFDRTEKTN